MTSKRSRRDDRIVLGYRLIAAVVGGLVLLYALRPF
jgi:hypothetical protein